MYIVPGLFSFNESNGAAFNSLLMGLTIQQRPGPNFSFAYQYNVTSQNTISHMQLVTGSLLVFAKPKRCEPNFLLKQLYEIQWSNTVNGSPSLLKGKALPFVNLTTRLPNRIHAYKSSLKEKQNVKYAFT